MESRITEYEIREHVALVKLRCGHEIYSETADKLERELSELVEGDDVSFQRMVVNLETIQYMSSRALAVLVVVYRKLKERGGEMAVCRVRPEVTRALHLTRLEQIIPVFTSEAEAIEAAG